MSDSYSANETKTKVPDAWNFDALYSKALNYIAKMHAQKPQSGEHILYSCISLELLLRAALSYVSPVLLAEFSNDKWSHLYAALGFSPVEEKYVPRSITITETIRRLEKIFPEFNAECKDFCLTHTERRNSELHSGLDPFLHIKETSWLPQYYQTVKTIFSMIKKDLSDCLDEEALNTSKKTDHSHERRE